MMPDNITGEFQEMSQLHVKTFTTLAGPFLYTSVSLKWTKR